MSGRPAYQLDGREASREAFYGAACDPRRHVVVEACAGAGKTWMLIARIVRALVEGVPAQDILAITFTRKAAGEMRTRLALALRQASGLTAEQAAAQLREYGMAPAAAAVHSHDLIGLHERVLASARAVEIRTFHAWYAQLLSASPLDLLTSLGLAPGMTPVEDIADLKPALMDRFHATVMASPALSDDYRLLSLRHGRHRLGAWFDAALDRRAEIELADAAGVLESGVEAAADPRPAARLHDPALRDTLQALARHLGGRDKFRTQAQAAAHRLLDGLAERDDRLAYETLRKALFIDGGRGTPRKLLGESAEQVRACEALERIGVQLAQADAHEDHLAMVRLSRALFADYAALKRRRGLIDMADLERVALALLSDHELAGWVQERLDARVRHLLIDEFQDTSPLQWHALHAWLSAYAGAGGGAEGPRLFIVGDPKQSIYRFRRAEPRVFEAAQRFVLEGLGGTLAACDHTRRCAPGVVGVVNAVFGAIAQEGGIGSWRPHTTELAAGTDERPPLSQLATIERPASTGSRRVEDEERIWRPSLSVPRVDAKIVLRDAEAAQVALAVQTLLQEQGVAPQDILILARKRAVLARAAEALAARHLPHIAPEDLRLADVAEVQDLLAVLDVLASPGQDLSLARALKSPLFGAADDELLALAERARERGGWWPALMAWGDDPQAPQALRRAAKWFSQWKQAAQMLPPHDLLDRIVHQGELLPRLAAAVPPERLVRAMEAVRALLATALELDGGRYASPYSFVRALRQRRVLAPAVQRRDAVRLLTIHGAKGLEARVVLLMDAEPEPARAESASLLIDWPVDAARPRRVAFVASESNCPPSLQPLLAEEQAARTREEFNALYVALTRAEERLVISRTPPRSSLAGSWWSRLEALAAPWPLSPSGPTEVPPRRVEFEAWLSAQAPQLGSAPAAVPLSDDSAARLGQAVHRVLEWATNQPAAERPALAQAAARAFGLPDARPVLAMASRILDSADGRRFFDPRALAWAGNEVNVAGRQGEVRRIDRLVQLRGADGAAGAWWVLDYKLAHAPLGDPLLREQLAAYRAAVAALVPGQEVRAAFVTGAGEVLELGA